jgi:short-subunit dehydrogenase
MPSMKGKKVLLTGAASGIGRCAAEQFAKEGCELILTDLNAEALKKTAEELAGYGVKIHTYSYNIADRAAVEDMARDVIKTLGGIDVLINNAGIGHSGEIVETPIETWKKLMDVDFWGSLYHVYAFLPSMIEAGNGHIVTVSSGQAYFRLPTWAPYATVKLALGAFSEMLRFEVKKLGIKVTTVYPFMVNTPFYSDIKGETFGEKLSMKLVPYYSMSPETVGKILFKAVKKQKPVEMVSIFNDVGFLARAIPPVGSIVSMLTIGFMGKKPEELKKNCGHK